eukprot:XP_012808385.1 PREDICTED: E3 ubiquitin/ISG15 ligase TRIM25-like [Xenopus tropicalis]
MATAGIRDELSCSICRGIYTDPVTLPCGHTFCRGCIERTWDWQKSIEEDPSCPECRQRYRRQPELKRNLRLKNIVERFLSTPPEHDGTGIYCTYCIHSPVLAAKSCLLCEASLCDGHVRVHSKSAEHVLTEPTANLGNRKCSAHNEPLKYHCCEDGAPICASCCLAGGHRGHRVELLSEASEKKKEKPMAAANLRDELSCSICKDIYTDPVTLPCGHNFCRGCIGATWDWQEGIEEDPSCPECRERYRRRPELKKDLTLGTLVEQFFPSNQGQDGTGIFCTYCINSSVPAAQSCLLCEASLCNDHVRVHSKSAEHVLTEPTANLGNRKCSAHNEPLKYLCCEDGAPICASCCLAGGHRGHRVELLSEASEKKKEKLRNLVKKWTSEIADIENMQKRAANDTDQAAALFGDIREWLEALKKRVLSEISRHEEQFSLRISEFVQQLEKKKSHLSREIHHTKKLLHTDDPLMIVRGESDKAELSDSEEDDDEEDVEGGNSKFIYEDHLDVDYISEILLTGLNGFVNGAKRWGINGEEATDMLGDIMARNEAELEFSAGAPSPVYQIPETNRDSQPAAQQNQQLKHKLMKLFPSRNIDPYYGKEAVGMSVDINTASNQVSVLEEGKLVTYSATRLRRPQTPQRFQDFQALSTRSFPSGRHYWDMEGGENGGWRVGVAYPSIERGGAQSYTGNNDKSWALWRWDNNYTVIHNKEETKLRCKPEHRKIRIFFDYEAGRLSFYELVRPIRHLHTFTVTFTEPLHAAFCVWGDNAWVRIIS